MHQLVCGRNRKNIKLIESSTSTAIYFPPPFSQAYRYCPPNAQRRDPSQVYITGENSAGIDLAKQRVHELLRTLRLFVKDVQIPSAKIDSILLTRMDKIRKIMETNGTFIMFPPLGSRQTTVRIQATENLLVERTVRELMALVRPSFYSFGDWGIHADSFLGWTILHCDMVDQCPGDAPAPEPQRHQDHAW